MTNVSDLERKHQVLIRLYNKNISKKTLLFKTIDYFNEILDSGDNLICQAFISESIHLLIPLLKRIAYDGLTPAEINKIINCFEKVKGFALNDSQKKSLEDHIQKSIERKDKIEQILSGVTGEYNWSDQINFPIIEKSIRSERVYGSIDSFTISLTESQHVKDEFLVIPSLPDIDDKFDKQIKNSWNCAKEVVLNNQSSIIPGMKVVIQFNKKYGIYEGDSHGVALTLAFISALSKKINLSKYFLFNSSALFTGTLDEKGNVGLISKKYIEHKIKLAFYSDINYLIIPYDDYDYAREILKSEKRKFPKRELKLIPIKHIFDIFSIEEVTISKVKQIVKVKSKSFSYNLFLIFLMASVVFLYFWAQGESQTNPEMTQTGYNFISSLEVDSNFSVDRLGKVTIADAVFHLKCDSNELLNPKKFGIKKVSNVVTTENRFNESGKAFYLNGDESYIELENSERFKLNFPISISMWFMRDDSYFGWLFANNFDSLKYYGIWMGFVNPNILTINFGNGGRIGDIRARHSSYALNPVQLKKWYHIVGIFKSYGDLTMYLNNKEIEALYSGENKNLVYSDQPKIMIGKFRNSFRRPIPYFKGKIDDLRIFDRVLTEKEIDELFHERY